MVNASNLRALERSNAVWLVLLFLFSLPALAPLFSPTPTRSADGLLHLYRLVQLDALWQQSIFFTRWFPDVAFGYGLPLLNYYAPFAYYLTAPLHLLGVPFTLALNLSLAAALLLGAVGMFFFTRALTAPLRDRPQDTAAQRLALVAALAYLYAPYILFNALQRANLAEQWALAFAPFALWRFLELTRRADAINWALAIVLFAAVLLSHNVTGFLFAPLLLFFSVACILANPARTTLRVWLGPLTAFGLAGALAAFFLFPALLEREYAQIARVIVTPDFDYRFHFVAPSELMALLPRADTGRLNPAYPNTLGLVQILLASAGLVILTLRFRTRRALPLFFLAAAALGFTVLMLAISQPLWDRISLLSFVQLPMRVRGLIALCLAPLTGIFLWILRDRARSIAASAAIIAIVLSAFPMLYPRYANDIPPNPTLSDMFTYEQASGAFGTTSFGEYLPMWVQTLPNQTPFANAYARGEIPNRFVIPEGVTLCGEKITPLAQELCTTANTSWHTVYRAFYFPGWRAFVDGQAVEVKPTPRTGLISFEVPRSATVRVEYVGTDIEHIAEWISIASALLVAGIVVFAFVHKSKNLQTSNPHNPAFRSPQSSVLIPILLVALALLAIKFLFLDHVSNPFVARFDGMTVQGITHARKLRFGDALEFLGYDSNATTAQRGETVRVTLYWRAQPGLDKNLSTFVHLTTPDGFVVAQQDSLHPAHVPTSQWDTNAYAADEHALEIPASLAPGKYELRGGVYDPATNMRFKAEDGKDYVLLGNVEVK